jgi:transcriptional regulator with XRE-family HTH domain
MDDYPRNVVGPQVRKLRYRLNWTQSFLAERLQLAGWDCTRSLVAKVEAGQVWVSDFELLYFAKVLKVSISELFPTLDPMAADPRHGKRPARRKTTPKLPPRKRP